MTAPTPTRGPCSPWDAVFCCTLTSDMAPITGNAVAAATEILYNLSGQIFDECSITVRPCADSCGEGSWGGGFGGYGMGNWWEWGSTWPRPFLFDGSWYNITCGGCGGGCSCTAISEALLPSPVRSITQVKLDGAILTPNVDYRVDDFRKLVRLGGQTWPFCQDMNLADDQPNTWSATFVVGEAVPTIGLMAAGELACEIIKSCLGLECLLPRGVTQISRQGITITLPTISEFLERGLTGMPLSDLFISTYNPHRLRSVPLVYDVDGESFRRTGTA